MSPRTENIVRNIVVYGIGWPLHVAYEARYYLVFIAMFVAMAWCGSKIEEERARLTKECEGRGGFLMQTEDGYHCLDKSLKK